MGGSLAYYNEVDPYAASWLRNLIGAGLISPGDVDERSIADVRPDDLRGYVQCHFFAGIGVWSYALRCAGWPDDEPVWTGSCPCQPFSAAGKGGGFADERHLWPDWHWLIHQCRPRTIFGEQVASKDGLAWFDLVSSDLEGSGYTGWVADTCAAGFGAPHIRQRLYFAAERKCDGSSARSSDTDGNRFIGTYSAVPITHGAGAGRVNTVRDAAPCDSSWPAESHDAERRTSAAGRHERDGAHTGRSQGAGDVERRGDADQLEHTTRDGRKSRRAEPSGRCIVGGRGDGGRANRDGWDAGAKGLQRSGEHRLGSQDGVPVRGGHRGLGDNGGLELERPGPTNGIWRDVDWLHCRDGKWRPVEPATFPLAHAGAFRNRVAELRGAGNAINLAQAAEFVGAYLDALSPPRPGAEGV